MSAADATSPTSPEYLSGGPAPARGRRRVQVFLLASVGVVGAVAAGGWAALSLMAGGAGAASAVPADAVAFVSLDLDPSAAQKLEALRIVHKFPALDAELGLDARDDLRRWVFDEALAGSCPDLDYEADVAPWVGDRAAFALVPGQVADGEPRPMVAVQITDEERADTALRRVAECAAQVDPGTGGETGGGTGGGTGQGGAGFGHAFVDGYVVVAESTGTAEELAAATERGTLADDGAFRRWTGEAGDPGILSVYVAPGIVDVVSGLQRSATGQMGGLGVSPFDPDVAEELAEGFGGMAAHLRFRDAAVEIEMAGALPATYTLAGERVSGAADLPASTGLALSLALPEGWATDYLDTMAELSGGRPLDETLAEAEAATGLDLPEDVETLLGDGLSLVLDSSVDPAALRSGDPSALPAGVRVLGEPDEILRVVEKLKRLAGPDADLVVVERGEGAVAFGTDPAYVAVLAGEGDLGEQKSFRAVVPDADRASGVLFVDFEAGNAWVERVVSEVSVMLGGDTFPDVHGNLGALEALGVSSWTDGEVSRGLVRLTTD
jgi:hypothetical protein